MATKTKERASAAPQEAPAQTKSPKTSSNGSAPLPEELLKRLYGYMLKCRTVEEKARTLFKQGRFAGNYYAAVGQEATEVGCTIDLRPEDTIAPAHRDFIANIMKGTPLKSMSDQLNARKPSPDQTRSRPPHCGYAPLNVITPASTIAAQLNIGVGVALAYKMKKQDNVCVALSGDGSTSLGFWHEALNFSGVYKLPIVFVVENNRWAESVSVKMQTAVEDLSVKAEAYGFPGITVDGNDVVAVYRVAREAIRRAREGNGPTLIECKTYRWYGHSEIDPAKYRDPAEVEAWKAKDPIPAMERYLKGQNLWADDWKQKITDEITAEIEKA